MLISLGAQKAATSWLARYLSEHPQCERTPLKEVHYFDYYDLGIKDLGRDRIRQRKDALVQRATNNPGLLGKPKFQRAIQFHDQRLAAADAGPPTYEGYEKLVMSVKRKSTMIVGEITPANGLLAPERLKGMAALENNPLFILSMRDPVDRTWSGIRMAAGWGPDDEFEFRANKFLKEFLETADGPHHIRSDYATMLSKIDACIPADRMFLAFFEELLNQPSIDKFCAFLGVDQHPANVEKPRLKGTPLELSDDDRCALSAKLRPIYSAVEKRMGRLPARWVQNRDLA